MGSALAFHLRPRWKTLIKSCLDTDGFVHPGHDLSGWAKRGVLLLNAVGVVWAHQVDSHKEKGWEQSTHAVVPWLNQDSNGLVPLLWGYPQKKGNAICRMHRPSLPTVGVQRVLWMQTFLPNQWAAAKSGKEPINWEDL